jgi:hypothetical protein
METNQTAIEWLKNNLEQYGSPSALDIDWESLDKLFEQAKEMEKEQHGTTWDDALKQVEKRTVWARAMCDFDEYYEETYKK